MVVGHIHGGPACRVDWGVGGSEFLAVGQADFDPCAAKGGICDGDGSLVDSGDSLDDGEAESCASVVSGAGVVAADDPFHDSVAVLFGDSGTVVINCENGAAVVVFEGDGYLIGCVAGCVVEEVADKARELTWVSLDANWFDTGDVDRDWIWSGGFGKDDVVEVDLVPVGRLVLVESGEVEEIVDQAAEPVLFFEDASGGFFPVSVFGVGETDFEFGFTGGDGVAEFVGGVGDELALAASAGGETVEHGVHGAGEVGYFVAAFGYGDAFVELVVADAFYLAGNGGDWPERSAGDEQRRDQPEGDSQRVDSGLDRCQ